MPSGVAPAAARSLMLTAAARKPRSRHVIQSRRKWTSSTRASCVMTVPATSATSFSTPWMRPRRSSSASSASSPRSETRCIERRANCPRVTARANDGYSLGAGIETRARVRRIDPTDRDDRHLDRLADRGEPVEPDRRRSVRLRRRGPYGSGADVDRSLLLPRDRLVARSSPRRRGSGPLRPPVPCRGRRAPDALRRPGARARPRRRR